MVAYYGENIDKGLDIDPFSNGISKKRSINVFVNVMFYLWKLFVSENAGVRYLVGIGLRDKFRFFNIICRDSLYVALYICYSFLQFSVIFRKKTVCFSWQGMNVVDTGFCLYELGSSGTRQTLTENNIYLGDNGWTNYSHILKRNFLDNFFLNFKIFWSNINLYVNN